MKKKTLLGLFLFLTMGILVACETEPDPEYLAYLLSRTQTAMVPTRTEAPDSRCELFADEELSVILYSIYPVDTTLKMYVKFEDKVIGLEDGLDDGLPWEYLVTIGEVESFGCDVFEGETYAGRLYCVLPLPAEYRNAAKQFIFRVNGCDEDLLSIPRLSLTTEKTAGSGGGSGGGADKKLSAQFKRICGNEPAFLCTMDYEDWCFCTGGYYYECSSNGVPVCDKP